MDFSDQDPTNCGLNGVLDVAADDTVFVSSSQGSSSSGPMVDNKRKFDDDCFEVDAHGLPVGVKVRRLRHE